MLIEHGRKKSRQFASLQQLKVEFRKSEVLKSWDLRNLAFLRIFKIPFRNAPKKHAKFVNFSCLGSVEICVWMFEPVTAINRTAALKNYVYSSKCLKSQYILWPKTFLDYGCSKFRKSHLPPPDAVRDKSFPPPLSLTPLLLLLHCFLKAL
jgi:hypothetical protein